MQLLRDWHRLMTKAEILAKTNVPWRVRFSVLGEGNTQQKTRRRRMTTKKQWLTFPAGRLSVHKSVFAAQLTEKELRTWVQGPTIPEYQSAICFLGEEAPIVLRSPHFRPKHPR